MGWIADIVRRTTQQTPYLFSATTSLSFPAAWPLYTSLNDPEMRICMAKLRHVAQFCISGSQSRLTFANLLQDRVLPPKLAERGALEAIHPPDTAPEALESTRGDQSEATPAPGPFWRGSGGLLFPRKKNCAEKAPARPEAAAPCFGGSRQPGGGYLGFFRQRSGLGSRYDKNLCNGGAFTKQSKSIE